VPPVDHDEEAIVRSAGGRTSPEGHGFRSLSSPGRQEYGAAMGEDHHRVGGVGGGGIMRGDEEMFEEGAGGGKMRQEVMHQSPDKYTRSLQVCVCVCVCVCVFVCVCVPRP
jgi:hypothetical protein